MSKHVSGSHLSLGILRERGTDQVSSQPLEGLLVLGESHLAVFFLEILCRLTPLVAILTSSECPVSAGVAP